MDDLDPTAAASLDDLATCLKQLHLRADRPTYRALEQQTARAGGFLPGTRLKRVRLTRSNLSDVLLGRKFPRKAFLLTFVDACGIDLENRPRVGAGLGPASAPVSGSGRRGRGGPAPAAIGRG